MSFETCMRCQGQMVRMMLQDFFTMIRVYKCIQCGEVIDRMILENREMMKRWNSESNLNLKKSPYHR